MEKKKAAMPDFIIWLLIGVAVLVIGAFVAYLSGKNGSGLIATVKRLFGSMA